MKNLSQTLFWILFTSRWVSLGFGYLPQKWGGRKRQLIISSKRKISFLMSDFLVSGRLPEVQIQYIAVGVVTRLIWWLQFTRISSGPLHPLLKFDPILQKQCVILSADITLPFWICVFKTAKVLLSMFRAPQEICSLSFQGTKNTKS